MADNDSNGPQYGKIPSPIDTHTLALARALEERSSPTPPSRGDPLSPPAQDRPSTSRRAGATRSKASYSHKEMQHVTRLLKDAQREVTELRRTLDLSGDQLVSEQSRSESLEQKLRNADARWIAHDVARQKAEGDAAKAAEDSRKYKFQLEVALREIQRAQEEVDAADNERNQAEEAAARARDRERKLMETIRLRDAKDVGRAEGRAEGFKEGVAQGREEARLTERRRAMEAFSDVLEREFPNGISSSPPGGTSADRRRRPLTSFQARLEADAEPVNYRASAPSRPGPQPLDPNPPRSRRASDARPPPPIQLPSSPDIPDVAPMARSGPVPMLTTPTRLPEPLRASPVPSRAASRVSRAHSPIDALPDGYVPSVGPDGRISLPPPHEVSPTPGVLNLESGPSPQEYVSQRSSRADLRDPSIAHPRPNRSLDPAWLFSDPPGEPPSQQGIPSQRPLTSQEIRQMRSDAQSVRSGASARELGLYDDAGPLDYRTARGGRLSRIDEAASERGTTPASVRYAAQQALPASRAPTVYEDAGRDNQEAMYTTGQERPGLSREDRERLRQELRNSDPDLVDELLSNSRSAQSEASTKGVRVTRVRRPSQINVPEPLDPVSYAAARQQDSFSRATGHGRSSSMQIPHRDNRVLPNGERMGHRRRTTSMSTAAPTIVVQPPSEGSTRAHSRQNFLPADVPTFPPSPASTVRTVREPQQQERARRESEYGLNEATSRPTSTYRAAQAPFPPSAAPTMRELPREYEGGDRSGNAADVPLPHSTAPSFAPLPSDDRRSQVFQDSFQDAPPRAPSRGPSRGPSRYTTPAYASYPLPASDNRTAAPTPMAPYADLDERVSQGGYGMQPPARSHSRAPTVVGSPMNGAGPSRARMSEDFRTPMNGYPALPDSRATSMDSPTSDVPVSFRPVSRARSTRSVRAPEENAYTPRVMRSDIPARAESDYRPPTRPVSRAVSRAGGEFADVDAGFERGRDPRPLGGGPAVRSVSRGPDPRPVSRGPEARPVSRGPEARPVSRGADQRFVPPPMATRSQYYDAAPFSDDEGGPPPRSARSRSRASMRSMRDEEPRMENEIGMAYLASGGESSFREQAGPPRPSSRASNMTLKSVLKKTNYNPQYAATTVETTSDEDDPNPSSRLR